MSRKLAFWCIIIAIVIIKWLKKSSYLNKIQKKQKAMFKDSMTKHDKGIIIHNQSSVLCTWKIKRI
jgi:hypothetical protein